jgi:hypothetical protein
MSKKTTKKLSKPKAVKKLIKATKKVLSKPKTKAKAKVVKAKAKTVKKDTKVIQLNVPTTAEQQAGVPSVIQGDTFEGVKRIDHLPLNQQIDTVFNPLHTITKTTVSDAVSESTFIVSPTPNPKG